MKRSLSRLVPRRRTSAVLRWRTSGGEPATHTPTHTPTATPTGTPTWPPTWAPTSTLIERTKGAVDNLNKSYRLFAGGNTFDATNQVRGMIVGYVLQVSPPPASLQPERIGEEGGNGSLGASPAGSPGWRKGGP